MHSLLGHAAEALEIIKRLFIGKNSGFLREGAGGLRQFKLEQQTEVTNRLAFAISSFVGNVDSTTDGYTRWRTPIGLSQFKCTVIGVNYGQPPMHRSVV